MILPFVLQSMWVRSRSTIGATSTGSSEWSLTAVVGGAEFDGCQVADWDDICCEPTIPIDRSLSIDFSKNAFDPIGSCVDVVDRSDVLGPGEVEGPVPF